jgi:hypothetical protein
MRNRFAITITESEEGVMGMINKAEENPEDPGIR